MSTATNRGGARAELDYYPTPAWCVDRLLEAEIDALLDRRRAGALCILEPTIGDGAILRATNAFVDLRGGEVVGGRLTRVSEAIRWTGVEIRSGAYAMAGDVPDFHFEGVDFRTWEPFFPGPGPFDLVIGNPPFVIAESILRRGFRFASRTAMLLRVDFLGSSERIPFYREFGPPALRVLPDRPSFDGEGTDSSTYAWFLWGDGFAPGVQILAETPLPVRRAAAAAVRAPLGIPGQIGLFGG